MALTDKTVTSNNRYCTNFQTLITLMLYVQNLEFRIQNLVVCLLPYLWIRLWTGLLGFNFSMPSSYARRYTSRYFLRELWVTFFLFAIFYFWHSSLLVLKSKMCCIFLRSCEKTIFSLHYNGIERDITLWTIISTIFFFL